jgi:2-dehydro-3-deoxyphosphogluconate aldolase / (4S)-4-hydroxy-2-oxoglutarate aldolase
MPALTETALQRLQAEQLLAVIRADSPRTAVLAGRALAAGGIRALEIAFTTPDAPDAIAELADDRELFVGAGTVLSADQAQSALDAGAAFLVSPSLVPSVLEVGRDAGVLALAGALTPTEVIAAAAQADVVKLFPASLGGPAYLRALLAPLPDLRAVPTGGVDADNAAQWLDAGAFALGAGGDLCPPKLIAAGDFNALTERARRYRATLDRRAGENR